MRALLLVISLAAVVIARPDIGLQLRNKPLATSYGVPSAAVTNLNEHSFLPPSDSFQTPLLSTSVPFYGGSVSTESPLLQSGVYSTPAPYYGAPEVTSTPAPYYGAPEVTSTPAPYYGAPVVSSTPAPIYGLPQLPTTIAPNYGAPIISTTEAPFYSGSLFGNSLIGPSSIRSGAFGYNQGLPLLGQIRSSQPILPPQPAVVQKHVYFYEAPQEPEELVPPSQYPIEPAKKNVKIIFIKAPHYSVPVYPQVPLSPQSQEKTIVYVLVKKPEEQQQIVIPTQPPTQPAKPEVYFIKYKNQQEAEEKVSNTLNEHSNSGANIITNGIDTASISPGGVIGNSYFGNQIISTTESPLGLVTDGGFLSTSTLSPLIDQGYAILGEGVSVSNNGVAGQYVSSSTEPTILSSTASPYTFAPIHPTYGLPNKKK